jgi:RNA polymerase sigma-70 factor (ECF subfamily)
LAEAVRSGVQLSTVILPDGQRIVFIMRHQEGLKLGELADALGLAEGTVNRQLHTAIHRLRAVLAAAKVTVEAGS